MTAEQHAERRAERRALRDMAGLSVSTEEKTPCPGCGQLLAPNEPCEICAAGDRMKQLYHERRRHGAFMTHSQPKE